MRTLKTNLLLAFMVLSIGITFAQNPDRFQAYQVHEDQVKPSMAFEYEKTSKALADAMREHNIQTTGWLTTSTDDFRYLSVSPIEKMADLDENAFKPLSDKIGNEAMSALFAPFNKCYDRHGDYIIWLDKELTYMPNGITQTPEGENHRKFFYLYVSPENQSKMADAMKGVKELFASKNSTSYYRVYRSGWGTMDTFFMVAIAAKDAVDMEQRGAANDKLLGADAGPVFQKVLGLALRMEEYNGSIRPDLGYTPKKE